MIVSFVAVYTPQDLCYYLYKNISSNNSGIQVEQGLDVLLQSYSTLMGIPEMCGGTGPTTTYITTTPQKDLTEDCSHQYIVLNDKNYESVFSYHTSLLESKTSHQIKYVGYAYPLLRVRLDNPLIYFTATGNRETDRYHDLQELIDMRVRNHIPEYLMETIGAVRHASETVCRAAYLGICPNQVIVSSSLPTNEPFYSLYKPYLMYCLKQYIDTDIQTKDIMREMYMLSLTKHFKANNFKYLYKGWDLPDFECTKPLESIVHSAQ